MSVNYWILEGDCIEQMRKLRDQSVHCVVTSPPYFGLRDYGASGQIGLEDTPDAYVERLVEVFREVWRVLRDDGTVWLNLGDSYPAQRGGTHQPAETLAGGSGGVMADGSRVNRGRSDGYNPTRNAKAIGLKHKDLIGIPWRVAFALQADGWYLRQDIIWHKPNPMPESVKDRCTKAHEYIFLLTKQPRYWWDSEAMKEPATHAGRAVKYDGSQKNVTAAEDPKMRTRISRTVRVGARRNRRSVWTVTTKPYKGAHFATFPPDLIEPCILAGCPDKCCPVCGAGWERIIEKGQPDLDHQRACGGGKDGSYTGQFTKDYASARAQDASATKARILAGMVEKITVGWRPTCDCGCVEHVAGFVLDPFGGSGTTAGVALKNGRNAILCELNPDYVALVHERVRAITDGA